MQSASVHATRVLVLLPLICCVVASSLYSPYEYGILQQAALRNNSHNLVEGWRQYGDRLLHRWVTGHRSQVATEVESLTCKKRYGPRKKNFLTFSNCLSDFFDFRFAVNANKFSLQIFVS